MQKDWICNREGNRIRIGMQLCWTRKFEDVKIVNEEFACGSTFCAFFLTQGGCVPRILEDDLCFHTILKSTFLGGYYEFFTAFLWLDTLHDLTQKTRKKSESKTLKNPGFNFGHVIIADPRGTKGTKIHLAHYKMKFK